MGFKTGPDFFLAIQLDLLADSFEFGRLVLQLDVLNNLVTQFGRFQFDGVREFLLVLVVGLIRSFSTLVTIGLLVSHKNSFFIFACYIHRLQTLYMNRRWRA